MDTKIQKYNAGDIIFSSGDKLANMYFLQSGLVILSSEDTLREVLICPGQVLEIYNPDQTARHRFTATALTEIKLMIFSHRSFLEMWHKTPGVIQSAINQNLTSHTKPQLNLGDENSIDILFSLLKLIYWSAKDSDQKPVSVSQILLQMDNLDLNDEELIQNYVQKLHSFSIIKIVSDRSFMLDDAPSMHLLIEFMQDMILTRIFDPWEFYIVQNHLNQLLHSLVSKNAEIKLNLESFVKIVSSSIHVTMSTIRKILQLWAGKNFIKSDKTDQDIFIISSLGLRDLEILLQEYKYCRNKILNLLLVSIPVYEIE